MCNVEVLTASIFLQTIFYNLASVFPREISITNQFFSPVVSNTPVYHLPSSKLPCSQLRPVILGNLVPPIIESVGDVDSTSISLSWKKYELHHYNSLNMLAYTILYKRTSDPDVANISTYNMINVSSVQQSYTLTELDVFTEYQIYLGTWNDIGLGALDGRIQRSGPGGKNTLALSLVGYLPLPSFIIVKVIVQ